MLLNSLAIDGVSREEREMPAMSTPECVHFADFLRTLATQVEQNMLPAWCIARLRNALTRETEISAKVRVKAYGKTSS